MGIRSFLAGPRGLALGAVFLLLTGCAAGGGSLAATRPANPADANFILIVSNQSFAESPVHIRIAIDGQTVVDQDFDVGNQHHWQTFPLRLSMGEHRIEAVSQRAALAKTFRSFGRQWVVVDYWYYPTEDGGAGPSPRHFSFKQFDRPPGME